MAETWTTLKVLNWTAGRFAERGLASARLDAEVLLAHVLGKDRVGLYTHFDQPLGEAELAAYRELIKRRLGGEPVAYIVGEQEFWSRKFHVDPRVLVPRPDTETLVEAGLRVARSSPVRRIVDACTGSGAVAVALAIELPDATVWATDLSAPALEVAAKNVARHGLTDRVILVEGDLLAPFSPLAPSGPRLAGEAFAPVDLVVANPPYVARAALAGLAPEVRCEPVLALDGGDDGLALVRRIVAESMGLLAPGGSIAVEHGFDQAPAVRALMASAGLDEVASTRDLAGHERVTVGRKLPA